MKNKYQGAVNSLRYALLEDPDSQCDYTIEEKRELVAIMQELVDKYNNIEFIANYLVNVSMNDAKHCADKLIEAIGEDD